MSRRKIARKLLRWLPDKFRLEVIRRNARIQHEWPSPALEIKIAQTEPELAAAYRLLHDCYVEAGFMDTHLSGMRVLPQHLLPQTTTIVAKWDGVVIATMSLIRDNPLGLPMEKIFDLSSRRGGGRLTECSSLAVDGRFQGRISLALFPLFRFAYQYARRCFGTHEFVCSVNPSTVDMYLALLCFKKLENKVKPYGFVKGAPAVGLYNNFEACEQESFQAFAHRPEDSNFHRYWKEVPIQPLNRLPKVGLHTAADPVLTPELLKDFFLEKAQLKNSLTIFELQTLLNAYPYPEYQKVIFSALQSRFRKSMRLDVQMTAQIDGCSFQSEVWNVSKDGLLVTVEQGVLSAQQKIDVVVTASSGKKIKLTCEVSWRDNAGLCGLKILTPPAQWEEMTNTLESPYVQLAKNA